MSNKRGTNQLLYRAARMLEDIANELDSAEKEIAIEGGVHSWRDEWKSSEEVIAAKKLVKEIKHYIEYDGAGE